jgi:hypothetical protein
MLKDYVAAWNDHDVPRILSFLSDDCVYSEFPSDIVTRGTAQLTELINARLARFPNLQFVAAPAIKYHSCSWSMSLGWSGTDANGGKISWSYGNTRLKIHKGKICSEDNFEIMGNVIAEYDVGKLPASS